MVKLTTAKSLVFSGLIVSLQKSNLGKSNNRITLKFKTMKQIYRNILLLVMMGATLVGCNKKVANPKPNVAILAEEGYTTGEKHLIKGDTLKFGFDATANAETKEKLVKFRMFISDGRTTIYEKVFDLNNEETFHCEGEFSFVELGDWQIVGRAYDAANEENSAYIDIHVQEDMEETFVWQQIGLDSVSGFGNYGLSWVDREIIDSITIAFDTIRLVAVDDSISLYLFDESKWEEIDTYNGKDALFKDIKENPKDYKSNKISAYEIYAAKEAITYNEVIAVMNEHKEGENVMLFIKDSYTENYNDNGLRHLTVNGKLK